MATSIQHLLTELPLSNHDLYPPFIQSNNFEDRRHYFWILVFRYARVRQLNNIGNCADVVQHHILDYAIRHNADRVNLTGLQNDLREILNEAVNG